MNNKILLIIATIISCSCTEQIEEFETITNEDVLEYSVIENYKGQCEQSKDYMTLCVSGNSMIPTQILLQGDSLPRNIIYKETYNDTTYITSGSNEYLVGSMLFPRVKTGSGTFQLEITYKDSVYIWAKDFRFSNI